jgi:hypothetical protein
VGGGWIEGEAFGGDGVGMMMMMKMMKNRADEGWVCFAQRRRIERAMLAAARARQIFYRFISSCTSTTTPTPPDSIPNLESSPPDSIPNLE